jgi:hypothetical protein
MASHGKRVHPVSQKSRRKVLRKGTRIIAIPQYAPRDTEDPGPEHPWDALAEIGRQVTLFWSSAWADPFIDLTNAMKMMEIEERKSLDRSNHSSGSVIDLPALNGKGNTGKPKLPRQDEPAYVKLTRKKRR